MPSGNGDLAPARDPCWQLAHAILAQKGTLPLGADPSLAMHYKKIDLKTAKQGCSDQCTGDRGRIRDREPTCLRFRPSPTHPGREHVQTDEYKKYNRKQKGTMRTSP